MAVGTGSKRRHPQSPTQHALPATRSKHPHVGYVDAQQLADERARSGKSDLSIIRLASEEAQSKRLPPKGFLDLPGEIRNEIYCIICEPITIQLAYINDNIPSVFLPWYPVYRSLAMLRVNSQISQEFFGILSPLILFPERESCGAHDDDDVCVLRAASRARLYLGKGEDDKVDEASKDDEDDEDSENDEDDEAGKDDENTKSFFMDMDVDIEGRYKHSKYQSNRNEEVLFCFNLRGQFNLGQDSIKQVLAILHQVFAETCDFTPLNFLKAVDQILMMDFTLVTPSKELKRDCRYFEAMMLPGEQVPRISTSYRYWSGFRFQ